MDNIKQAIRLLKQDAVTDIRVSCIFETQAICPPESPENWNLPYYNLVALCQTSLSPDDLLVILKQIERLLGRDLNGPRWSPRSIDLDILAWNHEVISMEDLTIPHQALTQRPFLMQLMAFLQPKWCYPATASIYSGLNLDAILHRHVKKDKHFLQVLAPFPHLVGIINITPDSFSDGGCYFDSKKALKRIQELISQGAAVIDIGAQSTRPLAKPISPFEEWERLESVFKYLSHHIASRPVKPFISLDSYHLEVIQRALELYPVDWINDVQGNEDEDFLNFISKTKCKIVINHSLGIPPSQKSVLPFNKNPIECVHEWAQKKIERFKVYGIEKNRIILDPGIGFGKTASQSFTLLRDIKYLKNLGCEILVGHSRKSFLDFSSTKPHSERDIETSGISHYLYRQGVDYLRVHNVELHHRSLSSLIAVEGCYGF